MGYAIAKAALGNVDFVVATTRKKHTFLVPSGFEAQTLNLTLDISSQDEGVYQTAVEQAVKHFGRIDVLVNNAGHGRITNFEETKKESIREIACSPAPEGHAPW